MMNSKVRIELLNPKFIYIKDIREGWENSILKREAEKPLFKILEVNITRHLES